MKTWLLIDTNYLAWRSFFAMGQLSFNDMPTGMIFGVLREVLQLQDMFATQRVVFAFDHGPLIRKDMCPSYKSSRAQAYETADKEERRTMHELRHQIFLLRDELLHEIGFRNVFHAKGFEADDIIASLCENLKDNQEGIIVSSDSDLLQCISDRVMVWNISQKQMVNRDSFVKTYGIQPAQWCDVKAMAGCKTDDIKGIKGIGIKTAAKFIAGSLPSNHKSFTKILKNGKRWKKNLRLVKLPMSDCPTFTFKKDKVTPQKWNRIAKRFGMRSLRDVIGL